MISPYLYDILYQIVLISNFVSGICVHLRRPLKKVDDGRGYWYKQNLFPDMLTVWIPLDTATRSNSCLQVLKGSHKCGRIDPGRGTLQTEADPERVEQLKNVCPLLHCEMNPGDVLFQHCNLLHPSSPNNSDMRRWAFVIIYNRKSNSSFMKYYHAQYTPLNKVPDCEIKTCRDYTDFKGKDFVNPLGSKEYMEQVLHTLRSNTVTATSD